MIPIPSWFNLFFLRLFDRAGFCLRFIIVVLNEKNRDVNENYSVPAILIMVCYIPLQRGNIGANLDKKTLTIHH